MAHKRLTTEEFIRRSKEIHGNKYDYSDLNYKRAGEKVSIRCPRHGIFEQRGTAHLSGAGCNSCWGEDANNRYSKGVDKFVSDAIKVHKDKYDYSEVLYDNNFTKIRIICKKHGYFYQTPKSHISLKRGCPYCLKKREGEVRLLLEKEFIGWSITPNKKIWDSYLNYNKRRYCDFLLERDNVKIMVEYDGEQHFKPVRFRGMSLDKAKKKLEHQKCVDSLDVQFCKENNVILHRIRYDENKNKSIGKLKKEIELLCQ